MTKEQAIEKVLNLARSEIGYHEQGNNYTKYAAEMDSIAGYYNGPKNGYAWCDVWVDWLFVKCFGADIGREMVCQPMNSMGAGCLYSAQYYKEAGRWYLTPMEGDQIFFSYSPGEYSHTGIVESVTGSSVQTIEGNSSDQVARRNYPLSYGSIAGYGRPRWQLATDEEKQEEPVPVDEAYTISLPFIKQGDSGAKVKRLQTLLIGRGYYCGGRYLSGVEIPDGDFGTFTANAVRKFQAQCGIDEKEVGPMTMKLLLTT